MNIQYIADWLECNPAPIYRNGDTVADAGEWQVMDDYYWSGPGGGTICRVYVNHSWQFEVWSSAGTRYGMEASLAKAIQLYEHVKDG